MEKSELHTERKRIPRRRGRKGKESMSRSVEAKFLEEGMECLGFTLCLAKPKRD